MIRLALGQKRILVDGRQRGIWNFFPDPQYLVSRSGPLVLFVHGYNNDQLEAEESYLQLRENLDELLRYNRQRLNQIWELYWPGYLPKGTLLPWRMGPANLLSGLSYPYQELKATSLGESLAEYIRGIPPPSPNLPTEVVFIAHSLGCRVVLEALSHLYASRIRVVGICLMAAAVPVFKVAANGALYIAARAADKVYVLHSQKDSVLSWAFRPGQFLFHPTTFPEAVGRFGNPFHGWVTGVDDNVVETTLKHGEYYAGKPSKSPGPNQTTPTIGRLFGCPSRCLLRDHYLVEWPELTKTEPIKNDLIENKLI